MMSYLGLCSYSLVYLEAMYLTKANARHVVTRSLLKTTIFACSLCRGCIHDAAFFAIGPSHVILASLIRFFHAPYG